MLGFARAILVLFCFEESNYLNLEFLEALKKFGTSIFLENDNQYYTCTWNSVDFGFL
jgi:hypothetical protein